MGLIDQYNLSQDLGFLRRVEVAACNTSLAVQAEASATPNHANRAAYAKLVLNSPGAYGAYFAEAVCANDAAFTIQNRQSLTDVQIQAAVTAVFNALAGTL